jgi:hypothetical protein
LIQTLAPSLHQHGSGSQPESSLFELQLDQPILFFGTQIEALPDLRQYPKVAISRSDDLQLRLRLCGSITVLPGIAIPLGRTRIGSAMKPATLLAPN